MENTLVFVDAGFLSKLSKNFGAGKYLSYDIINFAKNLALKQNLLCKHIFYYTAPPFQSSPSTNEEDIRKENFDRFIKKLSKNSLITIRQGRCQRLRINNQFEFCQKGVDTLLTMDLVSIPSKYPEIRKVILIACDSDFVPIIKSLKELKIKVILFTYYEKGRSSIFSTSNELIQEAFKYKLLTKEDFDSSPLNKSKKD